MQFLRILTVGALLASSVGISQAVTYTDTNWHGTFLSNGQEQAGTFDITSSYDKNTHQIDSATVLFTFVDDILSDTIVVGVKKFFGLSIPILGQEDESGTITVNGQEIASESSNGLWIFAALSYGLPADIVLSLSENGVLDYTVKSTGGDFWFKTASLVAEGSPRAVPDSATTIALLGASLLGLAALRRKLA